MRDMSMGRSPPRLLYPSLIVAAVAVTVFSLLGIASITGHLPRALAEPPGIAQVGAGKTAFSATTATPKRPSDKTATVAAPSCADCGVVESVRSVEVRGRASGVGAVLGGLGGALVGNTLGSGNGRTAMTLIGGGAGAYAGNEIEKSRNRQVVWQTRVRMDTGAIRTVTTRDQPAVGVGSKVRVVDGHLVANAA